MKVVTPEELVRCDGKEGRPACVAVDGKVYDVSASSHWRDGRHQVTHPVGRDLTEAMKAAPHGMDLVERFPVVGTLEE